ncbi:polymeric immunoglobulin receptor-like [Xyrauchen texanus]|uniref:polymeric immunoglobulin receptor-like n=1 Tax=Xyrauchen texanus TaxID=154827 RepID=UPI002241BFC4|nr:polymeric immunoglobulin receptor-like [Xyrauchen texanus]
MNIILTFALLMIPGAVTSISVTGYSEGGVIITCKYEMQYRTNVKYFCRWQWSRCSDLIRVDIKDEWTQLGRFFLYDSTRAAVFTVIIRDLNEQDSGTYYCGFYTPLHLYSYTEVNLNVREGVQRKTITGYSGGNILINSKYEKEHKNSLKYVCKTTTQPCFDLIYSKNIPEWSRNDSLSIHDDTTAGLLRVFFRELNVEDSGKYLIIFLVSEEYRVFSELNLDVKEDDCCEKVVSLSAPSGESVNISCRYPQSHISDSKFFCRISGAGTCANETQERQLQLYDDREDHLLTVTISNVTDSAEYWCGVQSPQYKIFITRVQLTVTVPPLKRLSSDSSLIIILSVVLVLIFIGLLLLIVTLYKRHPTRGADSSRQRENETVTPTACDYEEIKDLRLHDDSDTGRSAECNTAQILTNTSDNALYSTDTLNYAVVNFQKKSDGVDRISFSNNQDYSEYATVNKAAV